MTTPVDPFHHRRAVRGLLTVVIVGLVLSGLTAFALLWEMNLLAQWVIGPAGHPDPAGHEGLARWLLRVREGLAATYRQYPFMGYGTDWLAFGHLVIAGFFIPAWRDPRRYVGNLIIGAWACAAVVPIAMICGAIREIPLGWRIIDCLFGVVGIVPLLIAIHLIRRADGASAEPAVDAAG